MKVESEIDGVEIWNNSKDLFKRVWVFMSKQQIGGRKQLWMFQSRRFWSQLFRSNALPDDFVREHAALDPEDMVQLGQTLNFRNIS